ncbi:MAG: GNAT family N-acetyltransferase [Blautia hansenii]
MYLRKLKFKDASLMLEWMHDDCVVHDLHTDFASKTIKDCEEFIRNNQEFGDNINYAIASENDEYMGTVSLKQIDRKDLSAEFAITVRSVSMGHGYSWFGMKAIIEKAFFEYGLESVYWCVSRKNERAVRFYDKHNFHEAVDIPLNILSRYEDEKDLKWYSVLKGDVFENRDSIVGCKIIHIKTIPTVNAGELSFYEANRDIDFDIKRQYYISKVPEGVRRGFHAHKELKQLLFCPYGRIQLILENELGREEIELSDPSTGVVIDRPTWREMLWLQKDSVLCVAVSDYYKTEDYIRDYDEFKKYLKENK